MKRHPIHAGAVSALAVLFLVTLSATGCDILDPDSSLTSIDVDLFNDDDTAIHILAEDEPFASSNQIQPGGGRTVNVGGIEGQAIEFRAGRNGTVLASVECVPQGDLSGLSPVVVWTGTALACSQWYEPED